jgi:hypothetical protein
MGAPEHPYNPKDPKNAPEVVVSEEEDYKYFIPTDNASLAPEVAAVDSEKELIDKSMAGLEGKPVRTGSGKREFGLRPRTFWVLLAVIGIVVIGAAIGGGISGAAAIAKAKSKPTNTASRYASYFLSFIGEPSTYWWQQLQYSVKHIHKFIGYIHKFTDRRPITTY